MPDLYITYAHPNPHGKDRPPYGGPSNDQLNQEWVEFTNPTQTTWDLAGVWLAHDTYDARCQRTGHNQLLSFHGNLAPGKSVRVHTGKGEDRTEGQMTHLYAGRGNYAWNNACGDLATLLNSADNVIDWAFYSPNPKQGTTLRRVPGTNQLR